MVDGRRMPLRKQHSSKSPSQPYYCDRDCGFYSRSFVAFRVAPLGAEAIASERAFLSLPVLFREPDARATAVLWNELGSRFLECSLKTLDCIVSRFPLRLFEIGDRLLRYVGFSLQIVLGNTEKRASGATLFRCHFVHVRKLRF
jgi:hypothetical protein